MYKIYHSKWFPRLFYKKYDGGIESGVIGYFLIEWKILFSIGLLRFSKGSRENYHSHAFNAITWWLKGKVREETHINSWYISNKNFTTSIIPKITTRSKVHKVHSVSTTWALTFRGPWSDTWYEVDKDGNKITLTHNRKIVE